MTLYIFDSIYIYIYIHGGLYCLLSWRCVGILQNHGLWSGEFLIVKATERSQSSTWSLRGRGWMHMIICSYSLHEWEGSVTASAPYGLRHTTHFLSFNHDLSLISHMDFLIRPYAWILAPRFPPLPLLMSFSHVHSSPLGIWSGTDVVFTSRREWRLRHESALRHFSQFYR